MKNAKLLVAILVLQSVILVGQWVGHPQMTSAANAQIPDAGAIRLQVLEEMKALNGKMEKIIGILESGKLEVKVAPADEKGEKR